uniref:RNA-directed DNA polymerase n=1 Tax=Megaselia scalaris TaxID=36166 RepID=T1GQ26_MEGSC
MKKGNTDRGKNGKRKIPYSPLNQAIGSLWEVVFEAERLQIVVPRSRRKEILQEYHDNYSGGHLGINKKKQKTKLEENVIGQPWKSAAIDVADPFPRSHNGEKYILVAMNYFSKWVEVYPMPNQEAPTVAHVLIENWISRYGVPIELHSH